MYIKSFTLYNLVILHLFTQCSLSAQEPTESTNAAENTTLSSPPAPTSFLVSSEASHNGTLNNGSATTCPPEPHPLSWQSALWGLIALSVNNMTQRSGSDHFPSSDSLSPSRCSPFICLADIIVAILWIVQGWQRGLGLRGGAHWYRKEMGLLREKSDRDLIQGVPVVTIAFFVLGPLPQAIKLFGARGLGWTKVWAGVFFGAWVFEVLIRFVSALPRGFDVDTVDAGFKAQSSYLRSVSRMIFQAAILVQMIVWVWILVKLALSEAIQYFFGVILMTWIWGSFIVFLMYAVFGLFAAVPALMCQENLGRWRTIFRVIVLFDVFLGFLFGFSYFYYHVYLLSLVFDWLLGISRPFGFVIGLFVLPTAIFLFILLSTTILIALDTFLVTIGKYSNETTEIQPMLGAGPGNEDDHDLTVPIRRTTSISVTDDWQGRTWKRACEWSDFLSWKTSRISFHWDSSNGEQSRRARAMAFALANLCFTTLFYSYKYNPEGVVKPSWTEALE